MTTNVDMKVAHAQRSETANIAATIAVTQLIRTWWKYHAGVVMTVVL